MIIAVTLGVFIALFFSYKQLLFMTFDQEVARLYGVKTRFVDALFNLMLAATVIVSIQIMGVTLIAAALVTPAVIARLLSDDFGKIIRYAAVIGAVSGAVGMYLSFYINVASGATIVMLTAILFLMVTIGHTARLSLLGASDHHM